MLSSPVYAYGINLLPAERVAEEVMTLNVQLAQTVREIGATFTLDDLDQIFHAIASAVVPALLPIASTLTHGTAP